MSYVQDLGETLNKVGSVKIYKKDVDHIIKAMADEIHPCKRRNASNRPYDVVYKNCSNIVGEFAIAQAIKSETEWAERNPLEFDSRKEDSYKYDVLHHIGDIEKRIEFKRMCGTWFSMFNQKLSTFLKHRKSLDGLVTGYVDEYPDHYTVIFSLVINPKSFENYWTPSNYFKPTQPTHYYSHYNSKRDGECYIISVSTTRTKEYYDDVNFVIEGN